jgi:tetratricopeptide (TPR) repeat protein
LFGQNSNREVLALIDSAKTYLRGSRDPGLALAYCNAILDRAPNADLWARGKSYEISGKVFQNINQVDSAILHYSQALLLLNEADTTDWYAGYFINRNMASIHQHFKLYDLAQECYDSALYFISNHVVVNKEMSDQYKDHHKRDLLKYFIAQNHARRGLENSAFSQLLEIEKDSTIKLSTRSSALNYQGIMYKDAGMYDSSRVKYQKIIDNPRSSNINKARALHNLAVTYYNSGNIQEALSAIDRAIALKLQIKNPKSLFISFLDKGEYLMNAGQYLQAYKMFQRALELDVDVSNSRSLFVIYHFLDLVCAELNRKDESRKWSNKYHEISQDYDEGKEFLTMEESKASILASLQTFEAKEAAKRERERLSAKNDQTKVVSVSILIIIALSFGIFLHRKKKSHQENKEELSKDVSSIVLSGITTDFPEAEENVKD